MEDGVCHQRAAVLDERNCSAPTRARPRARHLSAASAVASGRFSELGSRTVGARGVSTTSSADELLIMCIHCSPTAFVATKFTATHRDTRSLSEYPHTLQCRVPLLSPQTLRRRLTGHGSPRPAPPHAAASGSRAGGARRCRRRSSQPAAPLALAQPAGASLRLRGSGAQ